MRRFLSNYFDLLFSTKTVDTGPDLKKLSENKQGSSFSPHGHIVSMLSFFSFFIEPAYVSGGTPGSQRRIL